LCFEEFDIVSLGIARLCLFAIKAAAAQGVTSPIEDFVRYEHISR